MAGVVETMIGWLKEILLENWQQKAVSFILAIFIWVVVNESITITRTIPNVPIRLKNLQQDQTAEGLLPNGYLSRRISLTMTGNRSLLDDLDANDIEVILNASGEASEWIATIGKKNLVSLNPDLDISSGITRVEHSELIISLSKLVTEKIPIHIGKPIGEPPEGYQLLDIWPQQLTYSLSGPEDQVAELMKKGLSLDFDLNAISREELDALETSQHRSQRDEVVFFVPDSWKKVMIPIHNNALEPIKDPEARKLHITFLRKKAIPLGQSLPIRIFYPPNVSNTINPSTYGLSVKDSLIKRHGLDILNFPVLAMNVSQLFLDVVQDNLELTIIATPKNLREHLRWTVQFIDPIALEDRYVTRSLNDELGSNRKVLNPTLREKQLRERFRHYMRSFQLYKNEASQLLLEIELQGTDVTVQDITPASPPEVGGSNTFELESPLYRAL